MKHSKLIWIIIILSFIGTLMIFPSLPEQIPTHWNVSGEIDDYGSKYSVFLLALLPAIIYLSMIYMPKLDPKKENYKKHSKAYSMISISTILTIISLHWVTLLATFNIIQDVSFFVKLVIGLLFIVIGNYMTQLRFNYFTGIKLPWTLASETVWKKTHRVGGICFMVVGIITITVSFIKGAPSFIIFMGSLIGLMLFTSLYSYVQYQKERKTN